METENHESDQVADRGRALVRAIEALDAIASTDPVARTLTTLLTANYKHKLDTITEEAPPTQLVAEAILEEKVLVKSQRRCCVCHQHAGQDINVHHIDPEIKDAPKTLDDAIVLCLRCHAEAVYSSSQLPADNKYSPQELRRHRDLWWEWCEQHPSVTVPTVLPGVPSEHLYIPFPHPEPDTLPEPGPLPPGSRLFLRRNEFFTGRAKALTTLAGSLLPQSHDSQSPVLITQMVQGMGGVGKTQLAVEFAYRYGRFFHGVHWLDATQPQILPTEIAVCGEEMDLPHWPKKQPDQVARVLSEWQRGRPRLVILDNIEDVDAAREWIHRLGGGPVRLLLTARRFDWPVDLGLTLLPLDMFAPEESLSFLHLQLPRSRATDTDLLRLADRLGNLPMALEMAGRFLAEHPYLSVATYLRLVGAIWDQPAMASWREDLEHLTGRDLGLAAIFALSLGRVTDPTASRLFALASYCAPNQPIPPEVLEEAAGLESRACAKSLAILAGLGLLHLEDAGPVIHPLPAQYAHTLTKEENTLPALTDALARLARVAIKQMERTGNPFHFVPLLPHIRAVTEREESEELEEMGTLWNSLGYYFDQVEAHTRARAAFERALRAWQISRGGVNAQAATAHSNLGSTLQELGDLNEALASFERALAIDEGVYGPDHPDVARDINNLGNVLHALGDSRGAWSAYVCALAILEHVLGTDHPDVATQHNKVGMVLREMNNLEGAREAFEKALSIFEKLLSPGHPHIRAVQENLELLESEKERVSPPKPVMHQVQIGGANRYFVCPECGTVREEVCREDGTVAEVKYYELSSGELSRPVVEKALKIVEQLNPERLEQLDA